MAVMNSTNKPGLFLLFLFEIYNMMVSQKNNVCFSLITYLIEDVNKACQNELKNLRISNLVLLPHRNFLAACIAMCILLPQLLSVLSRSYWALSQHSGNPLCITEFCNILLSAVMRESPLSSSRSLPCH